MIYFTSDLHLGHKNIIEYEHRPWTTVEEMDATLIENWNRTVGKDDDVFVLGDFSVKKAHDIIGYLERLNGRIHLLRGNHDAYYDQESFKQWKCNSMKGFDVHLEGWYRSIKQYLGREIILCHFPILYWDGQDDRQSIHLYGHMHSRLHMQHPHPDAFNVGVDVNDYRPVTLYELLERRATWVRK